MSKDQNVDTRKKETLYVTGLTGFLNKLNKTEVKNATVYTTNDSKEFMNHAIESNWLVRKLNIPKSNDLLEASMQSKNVKFLNFDFEEGKYDYVVYADNKLIINQDQVDSLVNNIGDNCCLLGKQGHSVITEFYHAMAYDRYKARTVEMRHNIDSYIQSNGMSAVNKAPSVVGGLIVFNLNAKGFNEFIADLNKEQKYYNHPECQIMLSLFANFSKYKDRIKKVNFNDIITPIHSKMPQKHIPGKTY